MTKESWMTSCFSIARHTGGIVVKGDDGKQHTFYVVNKEDDRNWTYIPPNEPADLIDSEFIPSYKKLGRERFIRVVQANNRADHAELKKALKAEEFRLRSERIKEMAAMEAKRKLAIPRSSPRKTETEKILTNIKRKKIMRTLKQFQDEVLAPLRKEREDNIEKKTNEQTQQLAKLQCELDSLRDDLLEFKLKQHASLAAFRNKQTARRSEINEQIFALRYKIKHNRVLINEEHQNKLGLAFAEYNRERREAGILPIGFDMQPKRHPEDPNSVSAKIIENETETETPQH